MGPLQMPAWLVRGMTLCAAALACSYVEKAEIATTPIDAAPARSMGLIDASMDHVDADVVLADSTVADAKHVDATSRHIDAASSFHSGAIEVVAVLDAVDNANVVVCPPLAAPAAPPHDGGTCVEDVARAVVDIRHAQAPFGGPSYLSIAMSNDLAFIGGEQNWYRDTDRWLLRLDVTTGNETYASDTLAEGIAATGSGVYVQAAGELAWYSPDELARGALPFSIPDTDRFVGLVGSVTHIAWATQPRDGGPSTLWVAPDPDGAGVLRATRVRTAEWPRLQTLSGARPYWTEASPIDDGGWSYAVWTVQGSYAVPIAAPYNAWRVAADERRVVFTEYDPTTDTHGLCEITEGGTTTTLHATRSLIREVGVTTNHWVWVEGDLFECSAMWSRPKAGGAPTRLLSVPERLAGFHADGASACMVTQEGSIYCVRVETSS
jgi:hypothetical protein